MAGCFECGNEHSGCVKFGEFVDSLSFRSSTLSHGISWLIAQNV